MEVTGKIKMEVTGKIKEIMSIQSGISKAGKEWKKVNFVIESKDGDYTNTICFEVFGSEKVDNFDKFNKVGDQVEVKANVSSKEFNGRYYTTASAWMVKKIDVDDLPY